MKMRVLIIDDDEKILQTFNLRLKKWGYEVFLASDGPAALKMLSEVDCQVVITDLKMPKMSGQELIQRICRECASLEIIAITAFATIETAIEVMKYGVCDFLCKPINFSQLQYILKSIKEKFEIKHENQMLKQNIGILQNQVEHRYRFDRMISKSKSMQSIFSLIKNVAPTDSTVIIYGETGTGKGMVARSIHYNSQRKQKTMVVVDCGALSETLLESELFGHRRGAFTGAHADRRGRFEQAHGGSIFLDEIANASAEIQKRLLKVIEEKTIQRLGDDSTIHVDVRVIAACNEDLSHLVRQGRFRKDLYYRLNVLPIHLPPLRERKDDILLLARHFIDKYAQAMEKEPPEIHLDALDQLLAYEWPGNVRELSNVMERTVIMSSDQTIRRFYFTEQSSHQHATFDLTAPSLDPSLKDQVAQLEQSYLKIALQIYRGRINKVAKRSGLGTRTLYRKMKRYSLDKQYYR